MKLINPNAEYIPQGNTLDDIYDHIEQCARTCYKSIGHKGKPFIDGLIKRGHTSMLEHGTVYLVLTSPQCPLYILNTLLNNPYSKYSFKLANIEGRTRDRYYITTNLRVLLENFPKDYLDIIEKYGSPPTNLHPKRYTVKVTCDRGVSHELVRHRVFSFAQESQRYCNYSKDKFNHEITFIDPSWNMLLSGVYNGIDKFDGDYFNHALRDAEKYYFKLLDLGWTPQQARSVLPNAIKTEIIMTGFADDWEHFFDLRLRGTTGKPHPDMQNVAELINTELVNKCNINI